MELINNYLINIYFSNTFLIYFYITIISLIVGSFINMLIYRLPIMLFNEWHEECVNYIATNTNTNKSEYKINKKHTQISIIKPLRSICTSCNNKIAIYDNIPIISFILLKAKCRHCGNKISFKYPIIESLTVLLSIVVIIVYSLNITSLSILLLTYLLIIISFIDYEHYIIPDNLNYIGLWLGLLVNSSDYGLITLESSVYGTVFGYLFLWAIYWLFKLIRGVEGFGHGDFKLAALFGAWIGIYNILAMLIIASIVAIVINIFKFIINYFTNNPVVINKPFPFGPYLAISGWIIIMLIPFDNNILNFLSYK